MIAKQFKNTIASLGYFVVRTLAKLSLSLSNSKSNDVNKHLLLIKTDEIGDYVLMHSYLKYFKQSSKYSGYKITLVGNGAWRQLFETFDANTVDGVVWMDKKKFKSDLGYRFNFLKQIRALRATDVVNLIFSRSLYFDDALAWVATGQNKIGMKGDATNQVAGLANRDNKIYTKLIDAGDVTIFDTLRNRAFVSNVTGLKDLPLTTSLATNTPLLIEPINIGYYVIFLGAGNPERKWGLSNFLEAAEHIHQKHGLMPVLCGGPDDNELAEDFIKLYQHQATNYTGKTSLLQLVGLLQNAKLLISVDTGALHIAAAVRCPVVGLFSGKFYGRFAPYPYEITNKFFPVYPDFVDKLIAVQDTILYDTGKMKNDTIKLIAAAKAIGAIDMVLGG